MVKEIDRLQNFLPQVGDSPVYHDPHRKFFNILNGSRMGLRALLNPNFISSISRAQKENAANDVPANELGGEGHVLGGVLAVGLRPTSAIAAPAGHPASEEDASLVAQGAEVIAGGEPVVVFAKAENFAGDTTTNDTRADVLGAIIAFTTATTTA